MFRLKFPIAKFPLPLPRTSHTLAHSQLCVMAVAYSKFSIDTIDNQLTKTGVHMAIFKLVNSNSDLPSKKTNKLRIFLQMS
nr:hypothetical protein BCU33_13615 [Vibrio lentus]PMJ05466.1 hypothetical protein BCU31_07815 [Vibrio lentus]